MMVGFLRSIQAQREKFFLCSYNKCILTLCHSNDLVSWQKIGLAVFAFIVKGEWKDAVEKGHGYFSKNYCTLFIE